VPTMKGSLCQRSGDDQVVRQTRFTHIQTSPGRP
jgi:hypothetical protein